jgi:HEAT repeat protein
VAGNALLALHRLGETASVAALLKMAAHASPMFRATAAWVMGQTQDARFLQALGRMESDSDENVRRNASQAIARISQPAK